MKLCIVTTFIFGPTSKSLWISNYKFCNQIKFEYSWNFKGVQTFWEESYKFSKILSWGDIHECELVGRTCMQEVKFLYKCPFDLVSK
jgi:hypothetical protein